MKCVGEAFESGRGREECREGDVCGDGKCGDEDRCRVDYFDRAENGTSAIILEGASMKLTMR